jgi:hypothetical protein
MSFQSLGQLSNLGSWLGSIGNSSEGSAFVGPLPSNGSSSIQQQPSEDDYFNVAKFEELLNRLEGSKQRQQRQKSVEGRRNIYATGLAGMMSNF